MKNKDIEMLQKINDKMLQVYFNMKKYSDQYSSPAIDYYDSTLDAIVVSFEKSCKSLYMFINILRGEKI